MCYKRIDLFKGKSNIFITFYEGEFGNYAIIERNCKMQVYQVSEEFANNMISDYVKDGYKLIER